MRRKPIPDTRLSWRDPNIPVIRAYKFGNGKTQTEVDPDYEQRYRAHLMTDGSQPSYQNDPTYNLRKPKP